MADTARSLFYLAREASDHELEEVSVHECVAEAAVLAAKSPVALQIAKSAFYAAADLEYDKAFAYMNEAFARLCSSEDAKEGVSAFLEKRKPGAWKGK